MKKLLIGGLVALLVLAGCSTGPKKEPQKAVDEGFSKLVEVKKSNTKTMVSGLLNAPPGETPKQVKFSMELSGMADSSDENSPKVDGKMKINVSMDDQGGSGEVMIKMVDKKLYVNIGNVQIAGEAGKELQEQLGLFLNTWWALPLDAGQTNPFAAIMEERKKMQELFKSSKFFINAKEVGSESVEGISATRYTVDLDKGALTKFITEIAKLGGTVLPPGEETAISEALSDIEFSGSVWVGEDEVMHRIKGTVTLQPKQGPTGSFEFDQTSFDHGKDFTVTAPAGAQEFNPLLMMGLMGGGFDTPSLPDGEKIPGLPQ